jgi:hypothetical protein
MIFTMMDDTLVIASTVCTSARELCVDFVCTLHQLTGKFWTLQTRPTP